MAAREPTTLETLKDAGRYIDYALLPATNEVPGILAALIYGNDLVDKVAELRQEGLTDAQISHEVGHFIAPPDPDAGATIVQGVPPEQHQALLDEVAQLRQAVQEMRGGSPPAQSAPVTGPPAAVAPVTPGQTTGNAPPVATPDTLTAEQQELQALREQVQALQIAEAAEQHPTATSEPVPAPGPESGGGTAPPAADQPPAAPADPTAPAPAPVDQPVPPPAPVDPTVPAPVDQSTPPPAAPAAPAE